MSRVSVVMPVRNGAAYIAEAIGSALGETVSEVIVVDDGSTDHTREIVESIQDGRVRLIASDGERLPAARNSGIRRASGDWILFLDADDRLCPGSVAALLRAAERDSHIALVYGDYDRIASDGRQIGRRRLARFRRKPSGNVLDAIARANFMTVGSGIVRTAALDEVGGFNEALRFCEDWELWCRLAARWPFLHVRGLQVLEYRIHDKSMMHAKVRPYEDMLPAVEAMYADQRVRAGLGGQLRQARRAAEASCLAYLGTEAIRLGLPGQGLAHVFRACVKAPARAPVNLLKAAGTFVGL